MTDLLKLGKKLFTVSVVALTILWSIGLAALVPTVASAETCPTLQAGDLFKVPGLSSVYLVNKDMKRMYFFNGEVYKTWYKDYSGVQTIPATCTDAYPNGGAVSYRPGSFMLKTPISPTVYAVTGNGQLTKIADEASASALYGASWSKLVRDANDAYFGVYTIASGNLTATPHEGMLVKKTGDTVVYYVQNGQLLAVSGDLSSVLAGSVRTVSADVFGKLAVGTATVTSATILANANAQSAGGTTTGGTVVGGNVSASLSADTPAAGTVVAGQAIADLAHFTFTGSGTVTQVVFKRIGVSSDNTLANVYLYQGNVKLTDAGSVSNGVVTFGNSAGLFTVNGAATISVKADITAGQAVSGQTVGMQLTSYTVASGTPVTANVSSNLMNTAYTADLATVQLTNAGSIGGGGNVNAGTMNYNLWSGNLSVGQRNVTLRYVHFKQVGSIPTDAVQNVKLFLDGAQVGSTVAVDSGNNVSFDLSASPINLTSGGHTLELHGDIVKGSSYTYDFSLQTPSDIILVDSSYNVNLLLTNSSGNQIFSQAPAVASINGGTVSVQLDPKFTATQFVRNASNVVLGQWTMKAYGEDVKVMNLNVGLSYKLVDGVTGVTPSSTDGFNNLAIYVNGGMVGSSKSAINPGAASQTYSYGTTNLFTIPAGQTVTVSVMGNSNFIAATTVANVQATLTTPQNSLQGVTSYNLTPSSGAVNYNANPLTMVGSSVTLAKNTGYASQAISPNTTKQKIGSYIIQAGNADGVKVTSLTVLLTGTLNTNNAPGALANLYLVTPDTNAVTPVNPSNSNNFSVNFTVAANSSANVDVYADVSNPAALGNVVTHLYGQGTGVTSVQPVYLTTDRAAYTGSNQVDGQQITVGAGSLSTVALKGTSPVGQYVLGGTTNSNIATYTFVTNQGSPVTLDEMHFTTGGTAGAITSVTVNGVTVPVVGTSADFTGLNMTVPVGYAGLDVPVTVNYGSVGVNGLSGSLTASLTLTTVKSHSGSGSPTPTTVNKSSNTMVLVSTKPTLSLLPVTNRLITGNKVRVAQMTVVADAGGPLNLTQLPLSISTNGATVSTTGSNLVQVIDAADGVTNLTSSTAAQSLNTTGASTEIDLVLDTTHNQISAGLSGIKTYDIYLPVTAVTGGQANSYSVSVTLGSAANFDWQDVNNNNQAQTGTGYYGWPSNTVSVYN